LAEIKNCCSNTAITFDLFFYIFHVLFTGWLANVCNLILDHLILVAILQSFTSVHSDELHNKVQYMQSNHQTYLFLVIPST
jgi:hypothetical protein